MANDSSDEQAFNMASIPPNWAKDELSKFIDGTHQNLFATFHRQKIEYSILSIIDACYFKIASNLVNPQNPLAPFFLFRSHSAYRAACATSMSGQAVETFILLRSCLEFAGYGLLIHNRPELGNVWLGRHKSEQDKKAGIKEFQIKEFRALLESKDKRLAEIFQMLYDRAIDFGAHPNERSITSNLRLIEDNDELRCIQLYMHKDGVEMTHAIKTTAEAGLCCLHVFQWVYPERFSLLGLKDELIKLRGKVDGIGRK